MRRGPHWDDFLVQAVTFLGALYALFQRSSESHKPIEELLKNGTFITLCGSAFVIVGLMEKRAKGTSPESHRSGKMKGLWRRCLAAFFSGYGAPGLVGSAIGGGS